MLVESNHILSDILTKEMKSVLFVSLRDGSRRSGCFVVVCLSSPSLVVGEGGPCGNLSGWWVGEGGHQASRFGWWLVVGLFGTWGGCFQDDLNIRAMSSDTPPCVNAHLYKDAHS